MIPCALIIGVAGCSKNAPSAGSQPSGTQTSTVKPKSAELTKDLLLDALKRSSINSLPVFLKITDVQFDVVNSVDTMRVIKGTVALEFLEDTFKPSRVLEYHDPSVHYQIQLLKPVKKKGEQISLPISERIDLANDRPTVPMPQLDDYGSEMAKFPHAYVEDSETATKAETLIHAATDAGHKADLVGNKWKCLQLVKESLDNADAFNGFWRNNGFGDPSVCISAAFGDRNFAYDWNGKMNSATSLNERFAAHRKLVQPLFDEAYPPVEKIVNDAKEKAKACSDYLLNL